MTKTRKQLEDMWALVRTIPGWLRILWKSGQYDDDDLEIIEHIEDDFLEVAREAEKEWQEWNRNNLPRTEDGWLEIFPEATELIPAKIDELEQERRGLISNIRNDLEELKNKNYGEVGEWLVREAIKDTDVVKVLAIEQRIRGLAWVQNGNNVRRSRNFITPEDVQRAKEVLIETVIDIPLRKCGRTLVGLCPLHNESRPSFYIYPDTNSCWCFGCQQGGDSIKLVMLLHRLSFLEAVKQLIRK